MSDENVQKTLGDTPKCITNHPGFDAVCLNQWSLELGSRSYKTLRGKIYTKSGLDERFVNSANSITQKCSFCMKSEVFHCTALL